MDDNLAWERDGPTWPHHGLSRFVNAGGLRWHVQVMGSGPVWLLLHGTGASTHSWRHLMPLLARQYQVVALDLPGHAFTGTPPPPQLGLAGMARLVAGLVRALGLQPQVLVGHSAGAAIAAQMVLDGAVAPQRVAALNGAFYPLRGLSGLVFPWAARALAAAPVAQLLLRRRWDLPAVRKLLRGTGSELDDEGLALYARLLRCERHNAGALRMMANWELPPFNAQLARWRTPLQLIVARDDRAVPPADSQRLQQGLAAAVPCRLDTLARGGHLVHETDAAAVAELLLISA